MATDSYKVIGNVSGNGSYLNVSDVSLIDGNVSNVTAITDADLLRQHLGERYTEGAILIILNIVYIAIFVTGLTGNICTCIVIAKNRYMHTATNYYLFSLAISDVMILLLALPPELYTFWESYPWRFGEGYCILKSYVQEMTSYASVLTIAAFTIERYLAICHPMKSQIFNRPSRAVKFIIVQWLLACICAVPYPYYTRTYHEVYHPETGYPVADSLMCNIPGEYRAIMKYWFQISTFAFFVYPMSVIVVLYICIGCRLHRSDFVADRNNVATAKARKSVIKMLVAVVVAFFVCWAPFHAQRLLTIYIHEWTPRLIAIQNILFYVSGVFYFVSSTVNPILYNAMSRKYRRAFVRTLFPCLSRDTYMSTLSACNSHSPGTITKTTTCVYNKLYMRQSTRTSEPENLAVNSTSNSTV